MIRGSLDPLQQPQRNTNNCPAKLWASLVGDGGQTPGGKGKQRWLRCFHMGRGEGGALPSSGSPLSLSSPCRHVTHVCACAHARARTHTYPLIPSPVDSLILQMRSEMREAELEFELSVSLF